LLPLIRDSLHKKERGAADSQRGSRLGETAVLNTDGYSTFQLSSLTVEAGGVLTAVGGNALVLEVSGDCVIDGDISVDGGAPRGVDARVAYTMFGTCGSSSPDCVRVHGATRRCTRPCGL
jgi:hypothetical protein